jgi:hypothetical protein
MHIHERTRTNFNTWNLNGSNDKDLDLCALLRIRIHKNWHGSRKIIQTNKSGSGSGSCYFPHCLLLYEGTFTSFFKGKNSERSHKTVGTKDFLIFFA